MEQQRWVKLMLLVITYSNFTLQKSLRPILLLLPPHLICYQISIKISCWDFIQFTWYKHLYVLYKSFLHCLGWTRNVLYAMSALIFCTPWQINSFLFSMDWCLKLKNLKLELKYFKIYEYNFIVSNLYLRYKTTIS